MNTQDITTDFLQKIDLIEQALNDFVDKGSDHELFLSGYLHGHFSLVVSQAELAEDLTLVGLDKRMGASLDTAFASGELEAHDQQAVLSMWQQLIKL